MSRDKPQAEHVRDWERHTAHTSLACAVRALLACPAEYQAWLISVLSTYLMNRETEMSQYGWRIFGCR